MAKQKLSPYVRAVLKANFGTATVKRRPTHWPEGIESELELNLLHRLERGLVDVGEAQYRFVPGRQLRFDRAWPAQMVAVEVQGGIWTGGAHGRGSGIQRDCVKLATAAALGWRVLPVTSNMIEDGSAVRLIAQALGVTP